MRRFIFVMRLMAFGHAAFSFRHAAFCRRSWGVWLRPSHLSSPPDSAVRCRAVLNAVQYVGGAVLSTCRVGCCVGCCSVRGQSRVGACQGAENAGRRLAVKLAAHPLSPRTAQQSLDWLRVRVRYGCTAIFSPSALFPGISRRCTWRSVSSVRAQRRPSVARLP